ncbi:glycosyltransferase [Fibrobacter sp. UWH1]|uniref:glycosyltransferase n=1 Tax=Fibrobacter sp. UWH1 TaxID=1964354 RepID=UPI000B5200E3|nr:glycosyltransferase [Fibrobacter sp. UWH1]OWV12139.1 hypothetical protein B7992_09740 [Fibrobacter sp. UWH1]
MKRILYIVDKLQPRSGITSIVMNYYRFFDNSSICVDFLTYDLNTVELEKEIETLGGRVYHMPVLSLTNFFVFFKWMKSFFRKKIGVYDIVHSHFIQVDLLTLICAKKYGRVTKYISHSHNAKFADTLLRSVRNYCLCFPLRFLANYKFACSRKAGVATFGKKFLTCKNSSILNNAIECKKFSYDVLARKRLRDEFDIGDFFLIGTVGRLCYQKNYFYLLDIMSLLKKAKRPYKLIIVGEGPLESDLKKKVMELGLEKDVIFTGLRLDVHQMYQMMDLFVLTSFYEGLPVVGIEAQVSGLPCLFSENITSEVGILKYDFLPIADNSKGMWVAKIEEVDMNENRHDAFNMMLNSGYDIEYESKKLQRFYECL